MLKWFRILEETTDLCEYRSGDTVGLTDFNLGDQIIRG